MNTFCFVKEKMSELAAIGMKLDTDVKLAIIVNGLSETYRYLVVNLEQQEVVDFDELSARLLEEEGKIHHGDNSVIALLAKGKNKWSGNHPFDGECYGCGKRGHLKRDCRETKEGGICHACDGSEANDFHVEMSVGWDDSMMTNLHGDGDGDGSRDGLRQKGSVMAIWRWK